MSKGGGKTQTVTQNSDPWIGAQPYIRDLFSQGRNLYYGGSAPSFQTAATPTGGGWLSRISQAVQGSQATPPQGTPSLGVSADTERMQNLIYNRSLMGSPLTDAAQAETLKTIQGGYSNPYAAGALGDAMDMARSKINAQFAGDNANSSAHKEWLGRGITQASLPFASQLYENERGRQFGAAGLAPGLAAQDYADLGQGLQVSQQRDQQPWQQLFRYQQAISGQPGSSSTSQQPLHSNPVGSALGGGLAGMALGPSLGLAGPWGFALGAGLGLLGGR